MRYTVCYAASSKSKIPALLFETLDSDKVAALPELASIFSKGYFVTKVGEKDPNRYRGYGYQDQKRATPVEEEYCTMVSTHLAEQLPDEAPLDAADLKFYIEGKRYSLSLRRRYNQCLSLFKAVGCTHCPDKGMACLSEGVGITIPQNLSPAHEAEDLWDHVREMHPKLGEFTLVKPGATRTGTFDAVIRPYWEHDFDAVEKNHKKRSEASAQGAETKKFKKTQCAICPLKDCCDRSRWCKGAYPPASEIVVSMNDEFTEELKRSPWPAWQLWEVARGMGKRAKHSRWQIILTGLKRQGTDGLRATVHRAKGSITEYARLKTYEDIAKVFGLALTENKARGAVKEPKIRAILWMALNSHRAHQTYGWGCRRYVCGVGVTEDHVMLEWTNGKYMTWGTSTLYYISDVARYLTPGSLAGVDHVEVR